MKLISQRKVAEVSCSPGWQTDWCVVNTADQQAVYIGSSLTSIGDLDCYDSC